MSQLPVVQRCALLSDALAQVHQWDPCVLAGFLHLRARCLWCSVALLSRAFRLSALRGRDRPTVLHLLALAVNARLKCIGSGFSPLQRDGRSRQPPAKPLTIALHPTHWLLRFVRCQQRHLASHSSSGPGAEQVYIHGTYIRRIRSPCIRPRRGFYRHHRPSLHSDGAENRAAIRSYVRWMRSKHLCIVVVTRHFCLLRPLHFLKGAFPCTSPASTIGCSKR